MAFAFICVIQYPQCIRANKHISHYEICDINNLSNNIESSYEAQLYSIWASWKYVLNLLIRQAPYYTNFIIILVYIKIIIEKNNVHKHSFHNSLIKKNWINHVFCYNREVTDLDQITNCIFPFLQPAFVYFYLHMLQTVYS